MKAFMAILLFITTTSFAQQDSTEEDNVIYDIVSIQDAPEFPGGDKELFIFLQKNIAYPREERDNCVQGKVFVTYVIDTNGSVINVELYKGIPNGPLCNNEALRVVKLMPKWIPGKQNGKIAKVRYILPISFKLQGAGCDDGTDVRQALYYYNKGVKKFEAGEYRAAIALFNDAIKENPGDIDSHYNKAMSYFKLNEKKEACETLKKIQDLKSTVGDDLIKKYCNN